MKQILRGMKNPLTLAIAGLFICTSVYTQQNSTFSRELWIEDYRALKKYLQEGYANLEWLHQKRNLDLAALDAKTLKALSEAKSDEEAKAALKDFLAAFDDGHLGLREPSGSSQTASNDSPAITADTSSREACRAFGYEVRLRNFSIPIDKTPGFQMVNTTKDAFAAGILTLDNGKKYGAVRIPLFSPTGYWMNCEAAWEEYKKKIKGACESDCRWQFMVFTANRLSAQLAAQVKALQEMKVDGLIVDIGGNGGGSEWVDPVARILSPKPLKSPGVGFIRHPHHVRAIERNISLIEKDLARKDLTPQQTKALNDAKKRLNRMLVEAKTPCDKSGIWKSGSGGKDCSMMNSTPAFATGIFEYAKPGEFEGLSSKHVLFESNRYEYEEGAFNGPLIIIVDRKTASASEYFASMLQDNKAATIIGEPTMGVGCGYTNGGLKLSLPNSKLRVVMPDCARYRRDGTNEIEGIKPDLMIWEAGDTKMVQAEKFLSALNRLQ